MHKIHRVARSIPSSIIQHDRQDRNAISCCNHDRTLGAMNRYVPSPTIWNTKFYFLVFFIKRSLKPRKMYLRRMPCSQPTSFLRLSFTHIPQSAVASAPDPTNWEARTWSGQWNQCSVKPLPYQPLNCWMSRCFFAFQLPIVPWRIPSCFHSHMFCPDFAFHFLHSELLDQVVLCMTASLLRKYTSGLV